MTSEGEALRPEEECAKHSKATNQDSESSNNFQAVILRQHGRNVLRNLQAAENTVVKIAKWTNHRIFNIRCVRTDIIPNSLKIGSVVRGTNAAIVLRKAEKRLLDIRVRQCSFTIAKLEEEYAKREAIVVSGIPAQNSTARNDVTEFLGHAQPSCRGVQKKIPGEVCESRSDKTFPRTPTKR